MSHYVVSDVHGEDDRWKAMLEKIHFSAQDTLYILGDVVDRGPHGVEILQEIIRPPYTMSVPAKNKWGILVYKTKRMLHTHRACNSVLRISLCKWVGNSILLHLRSPHTIFQTERK